MSDLEKAAKAIIDQWDSPPWKGLSRNHDHLICNLEAALAQQQAEPEVTWGVDWGQNGDENCVAIIKKLPNGDIEVVTIERNPAKPQADPTEGNPSY